MDEVRKQFQALGRGIYANTAASGLLPSALAEWRRAYDSNLFAEGSEHFGEGITIIENTRKTIGNFLGAKSSEVALVPNFSLGLNLLLENLVNDQNVLLLQDDYPSLNWPFEDRGFHVDYIGISDHVEETIFDKVKNGHIDIFAFSIVQWLSGTLIDLDFIKRLKQEFKDLVIIADGTQFCGMYPFHFEGSGIDVLGASGYKWLLGGYGCGFMMANERAMATFAPKTIGFGSVMGKSDQRKHVNWHQRLEPGHLDALSFGSLGFSISFMEELGMDRIGAHNETLSKTVKANLIELKLLDDALRNRKNHSTIFSIPFEARLSERLKAEKVVFAVREGRLRLSFHFYNTLDEVGLLMKILKS